MTTQPRVKHLVAATVLPLLLLACRTAPVAPAPAPAPQAATVPPSIDTLYGTLWMQTSVEYGALTRQAYATATRMLDQALATPAWTAAADQQGDFAALPPAVILDVDETVLDNSPAQARQILGATSFDEAKWHLWVLEKKARPIPGSLEFTQYAKSRGVEVFFVTNRLQNEEQATRENLADLGFPLNPGLDTVLSKGELSSTSSSEKEERRKWISSRYRVLLQMGDDFGDFLPGVGTTADKRAELAGPYAEWWGSRWIVLPNPVYGSWERALTRSETPLTPDALMKKKLGALRTQ